MKILPQFSKDYWDFKILCDTFKQGNKTKQYTNSGVVWPDTDYLTRGNWTFRLLRNIQIVHIINLPYSETEVINNYSYDYMEISDIRDIYEQTINKIAKMRGIEVDDN